MIRDEHDSNGRARVENAVSGARETMQVRKQSTIRPGKLFVPVLLAVGMLYILRRFEDSAGR